uniref:Uncharacterized protein n=1 Tax=Anguilla anguilla TaxID=7936 RepID=A0A0E9VEZ6_ANGAN
MRAVYTFRAGTHVNMKKTLLTFNTRRTAHIPEILGGQKYGRMLSVT